jgi:hypothetical protein
MTAALQARPTSQRSVCITLSAARQAPLVMAEAIAAKAWSRAGLPVLPHPVRVVATNAFLIAMAGEGPGSDWALISQGVHSQDTAAALAGGQCQCKAWEFSQPGLQELGSPSTKALCFTSHEGSPLA